MPDPTRTWKTKQTTHEGLPLFLRYPEITDLDLHKGLFPVLVVVTHKLVKVSPNGLPEPEYNDSLLNFDGDIRAIFEHGKNGLTVLIETFGGMRKYYFYVAPEINMDEKIASLLVVYPHEQLSWSVHPDSEWNFIKRYTKELLE